MDWIHESLKIGGIAIALLGAGLSMFYTLVKTVARATAVELKVNTIWEIVMQDSATKVLGKGFARMNSPLAPTDKTIDRFPPELVADLRTFRKRNRHLSDFDLSLAIASKFKDRLNYEVNAHSPELDLKDCVMLALLIAKTPDPKADSDVERDTKLEPSPQR